jgi:hypothetical protein
MLCHGAAYTHTATAATTLSNIDTLLLGYRRESVEKPAEIQTISTG